MSTSFGIKHLSDPTDTISDGGDSEGYKWSTIIKPIASGSMTIGGGSSNIGDGTGFGIKHLSDPHNPRIPVLWKDGSAWFGGDHDSNVCPVIGDDDGSGWVIKAEKQIDISGGSDYINGDDQYDAADDMMGRIILKVGGEGGYINGNDHYDAKGSTEYGGRTSEDISEGDLPLDPTSWIDPTWVSGHTNSFSGDWGT